MENFWKGMERPYIHYDKDTNRIFLFVEGYHAQKAQEIGGMFDNMRQNNYFVEFFQFKATWDIYKRISNTFYKLKGTKQAIAWAKAEKPIQHTPNDIDGLKKELDMLRRANNNLTKMHRESNGKAKELQGICDSYKRKIQTLENELEMANLRSNIFGNRGNSGGGKLDRKTMAKLLHPDLYAAALKDRPDLMDKITKAMQNINNM